MGIRWVALLCLVGGCAADADPHAGPAWLEVGGGEMRFEPLADGAEMTLAAGAQGGWHLWLAVHAGGMRPGAAELRVRMEPEGWEGPLQERWWQVPLEAVPGEAFCEHVGAAAVLSPAECLVDRPLRLDVTVSSGDGRSATDTVVVVPRAPATAEMPPCME